MILMGTGTSHGVPVIGCECKVSTSNDSHDKRLRCSALIENENQHFLIDVGPDFREQALKFKIKSLDGVFITHSHADHLHGIDDLRIFSHKNSKAMNLEAVASKSSSETKGAGLPVYTNAFTLKDIRHRFSYIFIEHEKGGGIPKLDLTDISPYNSENPLRIKSLSVIPIPMTHGSIESTGFVFCNESSGGQKKSIAYLTDCNFISEESISEVKKAGGQIEHLVIDALREREHSSHCNFLQALEYAEKIGAKHTWLTHLTHNKSHADIGIYIEEKLAFFPKLLEIVKKGGSVEAGYDGLSLEI